MPEYPPPDQYPPPQGQYPYQGQYPPPPGGYPPPQGEPYWQESPKRRGLAITALVLGIIGILGLFTLVGAIIFGVLALLFGIIATVKARRGTAGGFGMAVTGLVLGVLALAGGIVEAVVIYGFVADHGGRDYVDCVRDAGNDQAKMDQCERDFQDRVENDFSVTLTPAPTR